MEQVTQAFLVHGPLGAIALVALWFAWRKDREIREMAKRHEDQMAALMERHIAKAESYAKQYHDHARETRDLLLSIARGRSES